MSLLIADQWTVCFDDNPVLIAIVDYCSLLVPWMKLYWSWASAFI